MMRDTWTLVTVTYNNEPELERWWSGHNFTDVNWVVVDNASADNTRAVAQRLGAHVIPLESNVGFSAANNVALFECDTEYIAFVNPDVRVNLDDLQGLAELSTRLKALVAPQLLNPDGSPQPNGRGLPYLIDKLAHRGLKLPGSDLDRYTPQTINAHTYVAWVMGAVLAGRTEYFRRIEGWNESYFIYYEDHEIGLRSWSSDIPVAVVSGYRWTHGWDRATKSFKLRPWLHELRSAAIFYSRYPQLLLPFRTFPDPTERRVKA